VHGMATSDSSRLTDPARFFLEPGLPRRRQYKALRAYFVDALPLAEVARAFGYSPDTFRVLCSHFRHDPAAREFFQLTSAGRPPGLRRHDTAREQAVALRKQNPSVFEFSQCFAERGLKVTRAAVRDILREEGFAPLPRRLDEEHPERIGPAVQPVAEARAFALEERELETQCGGLFLFAPDLVRLAVRELASVAGLTGSKAIPGSHALLASLALKPWSIERKSHVMAPAADAGLALFAGLNAIPKENYLSKYSHPLERSHTLRRKLSMGLRHGGSCQWV
jgi:transposase